MNPPMLPAMALHRGQPSEVPSYRVRGRLIYTLTSLGEKSYFNPSVFNLLAVDFFLPYEVEGTTEAKPQ